VITVVGLDGRPLSEEALAALSSAGQVLGGGRHLDAVAHLLPPSATPVPLTGDLSALGNVDARTVVLASGDPGFFGIVRRLRAHGHEIRVLPAVSSVATLFARLGLSWDDAIVVSAHGRDPSFAVNVCRRHPKVAVLTEPRFGPNELAAALPQARRMVVGEALGTAAEAVTEFTRPREWSDPNVVAVLDDCVSARGVMFPSRATAPGWALPEDEFDHRDGMVTKAEVRALALAWLGPGVGDLVWDVGAGSGSVAVECARLGAAAIAVESDPAQCDRIAANAARHGVPVQVVQAKAPEALADLPEADAVFVGGGGHLLTEIVRTAADRARRAVVVALATVERIGPVHRALDGAGLHVSATMLQASRLQPLGGGHRLAAGNPVVLVRGTR
jgi:precorrin-6B C5,15-methyltransferase / cobalt-precorrin-6B C5,C15-methyltransferase